jgi:prepilin-type N-terminal cleavage/methylation domain-containing protein
MYGNSGILMTHRHSGLQRSGGSRGTRRDFRRAFSLVELLIVIILVSILAKMAITSAAASTYDQLRSTASILAGELNYARSLAVGNNSSYRFDVDVSGNRLVLQHSGTDITLNTLPSSPFRAPTDPTSQYIVRLAGLPNLGMDVNVLGAQAVGSSTTTITSIEFGPYGATTQTNTSLLWLTAGRSTSRRFINVSVNAVTGLASVGSYTGIAPSGITIPSP